MTLDTILTELKAERDRLDQAIAALEATCALPKSHLPEDD